MVDNPRARYSDDTVDTLSGQFGGEFFAGHWSSYVEEAKPKKSEIAYSRIWIPGPCVASSFRLFATKVGNQTAKGRIALFDQESPGDESLGPRNKVAETAEWDTPGERGFFSVNALSALQLASGAFYWTALVLEGNKDRWLCTGELPAGFAPTRFEDTTGTTIPAVANGSSEDGPLIWLSVKE